MHGETVPKRRQYLGTSQTSLATEFTRQYSEAEVTALLKLQIEPTAISMTKVSTTVQHLPLGSLIIDTSSAPLIGNHATPFTPAIPLTAPTTFGVSSITTSSTKRPSPIPSITKPSTIVSSATTISTPTVSGARNKSAVPVAAIVVPVISGVIIITALVILMRRRRKRRPPRIQKTDIQLISPLNDPHLQNSAREMFRAPPQYTNLQVPSQSPVLVTPLSQHSKGLELGARTPPRPSIRPNVIPEYVLQTMRDSTAAHGNMEYRSLSSPYSPPAGSYLGRSDLGSPTIFRDERRDTGESYGLPLYRQQSFNKTLADEYPELYSPIYDGTRNLSLKTAVERDTPLDQLTRESLHDYQSKSPQPNSPLHYSDRESQLSPPPLRVNRTDESISDIKRGVAGSSSQAEDIQESTFDLDYIPDHQFYNTYSSDNGPGRSYISTPTTYIGSPSVATDSTIRESQIPLSKDALEFDRINTQRRLGGLAPLPPGTPSCEWRTSEAPPRSRNNLPPPREIPRFNIASSIYPESDNPVTYGDTNHPGIR